MKHIPTLALTAAILLACYVAWRAAPVVKNIEQYLHVIAWEIQEKK